MRRTLGVAVAALGLIAWVDPKTATPTISNDALKAEAQREAAYAVKSHFKEEARVADIAFRLEVANQDLCPERRGRLGFEVNTAESFDKRVRDGAVEALSLGDGLTIVHVVPDGPAAHAGLQAGDVVVSANGEPAPTGRNARDSFRRRLDEGLKKDPAAPVSLVVRRAGEARAVSLTPVVACGYDVVIEDKDELNAYADGRVVHLYRPIIKLAATDEELALVIGHELAHNGQHHIQAARTNSMIGGLGGLVLDGIAAAGGVNTQGAFAKEGMKIGAAHGGVAFEAEADYVGMYYMARAGFSTAGVEEFWRRMAAESPGAIFIKTDHPVTPERFLAIRAASDEIEAKRAKGVPLVPNAKAS
jgi:membrane-associated protease RseP (regulator of RpoE activity)